MKNIRIAGIVLFVLFLCFIFFKFVFIWLLPFIISWIIAALIQSTAYLLYDKFKIPFKLNIVLILIFIFALIGFILYTAVNRILYEITLLSQSGVVDSFFKWAEDVPILQDYNIIETFKDQISNIISFFASNIPNLIRGVPSIFVFVIMLIISTFYISLDYKKINMFIMYQIPEKARNVFIDIKNRFIEAIYKYIKAYSLIMLITYCELLIGFIVIGIKYSFVLALFVAFIDILPVFGVGVVLVPWGIISLVQRDFFMGTTLLVLYIIITIVRQIIEPKILGKSFGLYPVLTLLALYVGYHIMGFGGMFLLPIILMIIKNLNDEGKIKIYKQIQKDK